MAKVISKQELKAILHVISLFPKGAPLVEIQSALKFSLTKRTLQRRLNFFVKNGQLEKTGKGRIQKYLLPKKDKNLEVSRDQNAKGTILLSPKAEILQKKICQPIQMRNYVSYNRKFLENYQPNKTYYLSKKIRKHLFNLGKTPDGKLPMGTYAKQIFGRLLIDLSWNSSRLEGNTYSLLETKQLLELGEVAEGKNALEAQMILNHKAAIEFLVENAPELKINRYTILNLHALLSNNLLSDPRDCGNLRTKMVGIEKSVYQPIAIPGLIIECFQLLLDKANAIEDPFEQAFFLMVQLPYLQPFEDVNKRVSRLAANIPFIRQNLCPLSFVDVPQDTYISGLLGVYEFNRIELLLEVFVWAYERSCIFYSATRKALGEPDLFRLKHRELIMETIQEIVHENMNKQKAIILIKHVAKTKMSNKDQAHFIEVIETELMGLHEGNIARYRLIPVEYKNWSKIWK